MMFSDIYNMLSGTIELYKQDLSQSEVAFEKIAEIDTIENIVNVPCWDNTVLKIESVISEDKPVTRIFLGEV